MASDEPSIFVGNLPQTTNEALSRFFEDSGVTVHDIQLKHNFAFIKVRDSDAVERAVSQLDKSLFNGRQISVQKARGDGSVKARETERRRNQVQTETVFIVNFEVGRTREEDVRGWCAPFGTIKQIDMHERFAFVQFSSTQEAADALRALHDTEPAGKQITVEFSNKDWNRRPREVGSGGGGGGPRGRRDDRGYGRDDRRGRRSPSPGRRRGGGGGGGGRSPSPYRRRSPSPGGRAGGRSPRGRSPRGRSPRGRSPSPPNYRSGRDRAEPYGRREDYDRRDDRRGGNDDRDGYHNGHGGGGGDNYARREGGGGDREFR